MNMSVSLIAAMNAWRVRPTKESWAMVVEVADVSGSHIVDGNDIYEIREPARRHHPRYGSYSSMVQPAYRFNRTMRAYNKTPKLFVVSEGY